MFAIDKGESGNRLELQKKQCLIGEHFFSDPDCTLIWVRQVN